MRLSRTSQKISRMRKKVGLQLSLISLSLRCIKYLVLIKLVFPTGSGLLYIKRWQKNAENYQQIFINHRLQRGHGRGTFKPISWVYLQIPTGHYHLFTGTNWHYINVNACISFTKKLFHIAENLKKANCTNNIDLYRLIPMIILLMYALWMASFLLFIVRDRWTDNTYPCKLCLRGYNNLFSKIRLDLFCT